MRGTRGLSRKIMEIPGGGGSYWKKTLRGGVWIFSGSTQSEIMFSLSTKATVG